MKIINVLAVSLTAVFLVACAGTSTQSGTQASAAQKPAPQLTGDALISANVKSAIAADPELKDAKINVGSTDGAVVLKGEIKTLAMRRKVDSIVKGVSGVKSVNNQLVVTG